MRGTDYKTINKIEQETQEILAKHHSMATNQNNKNPVAADYVAAHKAVQRFTEELDKLSAEETKKLESLPNKWVIYFLLFMVSYMEIMHWILYRG